MSKDDELDDTLSDYEYFKKYSPKGTSDVMLGDDVPARRKPVTILGVSFYVPDIVYTDVASTAETVFDSAKDQLTESELKDFVEELKNLDEDQMEKILRLNVMDDARGKEAAFMSGLKPR